MEINFSEYMSEDEKKQIIADVFRSECLKSFQDDSERIFGNAAYKIVRDMVNDSFNGEAMSLIAEKTKEVIKGLSAYTVFNKKSSWEKEDSEGFKALNNAVADSRGLLASRIEEIISALDDNDLRDYIMECVGDVVERRLFGVK